MEGLKIKEDKALVVFVRPEFMGKMIKFKVTANEAPIGWTKGKQYFYKYFDPSIVHFISKAENKAEMKLDLKPGKVYFIKQDIQMGFLKARNNLKLLTTEEGKKAFAKCKPSKSMNETNIA